ncbi:MAG: response regulator transcription factor [Oscillatoria sp. SIO1A7]|nr:response regulator transcription factor [Oscillatoria sp. SIO1A7]
MPLTILVVDDDPGIRLAISDYLELSGYSPIAAHNGQEALALVEQYRPHLMVTDVIMPQMDGYELVRRIRQKPSLRLLPVIFLTARDRTEERILGYKLGCDIYIPKPFELEELGAIVRNLLERSQLIQAQWQSASSSGEDGTNVAAPVPLDDLGATAPSHKKTTVLAIHLTEREREVLALLATGATNIQIGANLHLSPRTVEKYVSSLLRKTATSNRSQLVRFALEGNLLDI